MPRGDEHRLLVLPATELFQERNWTVEPWAAAGGHKADFSATSPSGKRIVVEAKNFRKDEADVDFWTLLGQVVVNTDGSNQDYAILIPSAGLPWFKRHLGQHARNLLKLRILVVDSDRLLEADANLDLTPFAF